MNKKIGQLFFTGIKGTAVSPEERKFIVENNIGGIILFDRNIENPRQVHSLCQEIQGLSAGLPEPVPFFIAIDMEGGRVARLKAPFTQWPPMKKLADLDSTSVAFRFGQAMGEELAAIGINVNFSPCVDVLTNPQNTLIGDRSLGGDPELVSKISSAIVRGFIKSQIIPCAKHFPGHGNTVIDSHDDLPVDNVDLKTLDEIMLPPFKKVFRARLDMVMTAHIKYPALDAEWPATLSEKILTKLLRNDIRYRNLIITDDLEMGALTRHFDPKKIPVRALKAGADMLMYCHDFAACQAGHDAVQSAASSKELDVLSINKSHDLVVKIKKAKLAGLKSTSFEEAEAIFTRAEHRELAAGIESGNVPEEITT